MTMKILIIGGTGNISSAITPLLLARGCEVILFKRTRWVPDNMKGVSIVTGDRRNSAAFHDAISGLGTFDCVLDMICYEPEEARVDVSVFRGRTKHLIFCSTVDVYTKTPSTYPITEADGKIGAAASFEYGSKKVQCEEIFWRAQADKDFAVTVIRPAFTYGDSWSPGIHSFGGQTYHLDRVRRAKPIIMHGDGMNISVATHRDDAAVAFANAVGNPLTFGQAYNLTGDEWMTQNHIWQTIAFAMNAPPPSFVYIPSILLGQLVPKEAEGCLENFRYNNIFDSSKAKQDLGFRYTISFDQGVRRCLDYLLSHNLVENSDNHPFYDRVMEAWLKSNVYIKEVFLHQSL
jgi:nucleoside-diphosphate-sugar epimerase